MNVKSLVNMINTTTPYAWDDSLGVYEFLGKIVSKLNEVVDEVNLKLPDGFEVAFYEKFMEYTREEMQRIIDSGEFATILDSMIVEFSPIKQEVIDARQGEVSLSANITEIKSQLAQIVQLKPTGGDDTELIQNAIDSMDKGTIYLQKGALFLVEGKNNPWVNDSRLVDGIVLKSGITIEGNGATIRADVNCNYIFTQALRNPVVDPSLNVKDIVIRNLNLEKPDQGVFTQQSHLINIESCTNVLIDNCKFTGWTGDAICFGFLTNSTLSGWNQSFIQNVRVTNCIFDGVTKTNRQAISFMTGEDVLIENCEFKNCTSTNMPGAIDVEPEQPWCIVRNIKVKNCSFYNVGGVIGVVTFAIGVTLNVRPRDLFIEDCYFDSSITNTHAIGIRGLSSSNPLVPNVNCPKNVNVTRNVFKGGTRWFWVTGAEDVTIKDNEVSDFTSASLLGGVSGTIYYPVLGLNFTKNKIKNYKFVAGVDQAMITLVSNLFNSIISDNTFMDCGNMDGQTPQVMLIMGFGADALASKNLIIKNNDFVNTIFPTGSHALQGGDLVNPETIILKDNTYVGIDIYTSYKSLHKYAKVEGYEGIVADSKTNTVKFNQSFNFISTFDENMLPDEFPMGLRISTIEDPGSIIMNVRAKINTYQRHWNYQLKFSTVTKTKIYVRYPLPSSNAWGAWVAFTGV